ncbi:glutaredoxin, partial [Patellaria atrata CBS 101060]
ETVDGVARVGNTGDGVQDGPQPETQETLREHEVEQELNSILKKSPIIIFSKTYCPYSKKAKRIFHQYKITPAPYIVEIDEHPLGPELQAALAKSTGRRTVPNILINGKSIGGGDDIEALHESGKLVNTVKSMGGKRI